MEYGDWNNPVLVDLGGAGHYAIITNALDAANVVVGVSLAQGGSQLDARRVGDTAAQPE